MAYNSDSNNNSSNINTGNSRGGLKPWQRRALQNGRTPLPESPGHRPWLNPLSRTSPELASVSPTNYRYWPEDEMRRLITLKRGGANWTYIKEAFSHRTLGAIKQAYHKRRHNVERQMELEAAHVAAVTLTTHKSAGKDTAADNGGTNSNS
ncbi:hypothetical protein F53441_9302 [Fusarium austroafricanum]|uniref:Myb-like domain-containing protein n=1 Tax=Fusarium austroafricanum TaxID=2364996 RepID=A0A8H4K9G1_9HYPO|nr:hypothetical protein F53441_9302 [Fusarium austroafricanum]